MKIDMITVLGFIAGVITAVSMLPQVIKTYQKKQAEEVSLNMLVVLMAGICLWIWYGIQKNDYPIITTNCISLSINICMVYLRHKYKK
jgi:MtN3 and saliva related transmembrane protein